MARAGIRASAWSMTAMLLLTPMSARGQVPSRAPAAAPATTAASMTTAAPGTPSPSPPAASTPAPSTALPAPSTAAPAAAPPAPTSAEIPTTPRAQPPVYAPNDGYTTPRPGPQTSNDMVDGNANTMAQQPRRGRIRQAPLAGAEASWGAPGNQMPEYAEFTEALPAEKGPPPRGMGRIVSGAILGPAGLGLTIAGIVGATTTVLGDNKRLSVPMIGVGLVSSALGWALFADGILRRKAFMRWQSKQGTVALAPALAPGRFVGLTLVGRF